MNNDNLWEPEMDAEYKIDPRPKKNINWGWWLAVAVVLTLILWIIVLLGAA